MGPEIRARLRAEAGDVDGALVDYAAAAEAAGPYDPGTAALAAAEVLVSAGRLEEAQAQLSGWLALHPLDAAVSLRLAALLAGDEDKAAEALALAERAVALRGGEEAAALAEQLRGEAPRT